MVNPNNSSRASTSSRASSVNSEATNAKAKDSIYSKIRKFHHSKHHHHHVKDDQHGSNEQIDIEMIPMEEDEKSPLRSPSNRTIVATSKSSEGISLSSPTPQNSEIAVMDKSSTTLERLIAMDKEQERRAKELTAIMLNIQKMVEKNDRKDAREEDERGLKIPLGQVINTRNLDFPNARGGIHNMTVSWPENFGPRSFRVRFLSTLTKLIAHSLNYLTLMHLLPCQTEYETWRPIPWVIKPPAARPSPPVIEPGWDEEEGIAGARGKRPSNIRARAFGAARVRNS